MTFTKLIRNFITPRALLIPIILMLTISCDAEEVQINKSTVWVGVVEDSIDSPVKAELTFSSGRYTLHYGVPRSCRLTGEEVSADEREIILRFKESTGGFCEKLYQGRMTIDISNQNKWLALVERKPIDFAEKFSLEKER